MKVADFVAGYPDLPQDVKTIVEKTEIASADVTRAGFRPDIERAKVDAIYAQATADWETRWDLIETTAATEEDSDIGALKNKARQPVQISATESTADRAFREAQERRDERLLLRTQLVVGRIAASEDASEVLSFVSGALHSDHADTIEFTLKAAHDRLSKLERIDLRRHSGQQGYRSEWADARGKVANLLADWQTKHPSLDAQIAAAEARKAARLASLRHLRAQATKHLMNPTGAGSRPERTGPTPEPAGTGAGGVVMGRAFSQR